jgi:hypothetical protein
MRIFPAAAFLVAMKNNNKDVMSDHLCKHKCNDA